MAGYLTTGTTPSEMATKDVCRATGNVHFVGFEADTPLR